MTGLSDVMGSWKIVGDAIGRGPGASPACGRLKRDQGLSNRMRAGNDAPKGSPMRRMMDCAGNALAAAQFPDQPEDLAARDIKIDAAQGLNSLALVN